LSSTEAELLLQLAGAAAVVVALLYALRPRRPRVEVPFVNLWAEALRRSAARAGWSRLRWLVSLLVAVLVCGLLVLAAGDPRRNEAGAGPGTVVVALDTSASMGIRDETGARTRLERAKDEAVELIEDSPSGRQFVVLGFDQGPELLAGPTRDPEVAVAAVARAAVSPREGNLAAVVRWVEAATSGSPGVEAWLLSDSAFAGEDIDAARSAASRNTAWTQVQVGRAHPNISLDSLSVRLSPGGRAEASALVRLENLGVTAETGMVELLGDGVPVATERLVLGGSEETTHVFDHLPPTAVRWEARWVSDRRGIDRFEADDSAYATLPGASRPRVLLVTEGNLYLEGALLLLDGIDLETVRLAEYDSTKAAARDVVIFDRVALPQPEPAAALYIAPTEAGSPWRFAERELRRPIIDDVELTHPLFRWIGGWRDVNIARTRVVIPSPADRVVATAPGGEPMVVVHEALGVRRALVSFALEQSDLPLRVSFPVFLINAISWLDGARVTTNLDAVAGRPVTVRVPEGHPVLVAHPGGVVERPAVANGRMVFLPRQPGFVAVRAPGAGPGGSDWVQWVAVNQARGTESREQPRERLAFAAAPEAAKGPTGPSRSDPWVWILAVVLGILAVEWVTWHRRVTV
jgi:hypothetical protein